MKLSIIIPCYNEEKRVGYTLNQISNYIKSNKNKFEIIVIDDGSKDKTIEVVKKSKLNIKIIKNKKNLGKGASIRKGILASSGDFSLFLDADSSTEIRELDKFFPYLENYDVVIGSRAISKNSVIIPQGVIRKSFGGMAHVLIRLVLNTNIKDTTCGFKAFSKKTKILFKNQLNNRWGFDYELLYLVKKFDFKLKQVPIKWKNDTDSKVTIKGYLNSLRELFMIRINDVFGKYNKK